MGVELSILGPIEAVRDGNVVDLGGPQQRALLALLAVRAGTLVPVETLVDGLWPEGPPRSAAKVIQTYVSRLRKELGDELIERRGNGYVLRVPPASLDLARFEQLAAAARLVDALALWRGPALGDVASSPGLRIEAGRLDELRLRAVERRLEVDLDHGRHGDVLAELQALVAAQPLRERLRYLLMLALYRSERQTEALATYREARALLVDELGIEPGDSLRRLEAAILRHDPELAAPGGAAEPGSASGVILVWRSGQTSLEPLVELAEVLAGEREVIVADLVPPGSDVRAATVALEAAREELSHRDVTVRTVAFRSKSPGEDAARLAREQDARLAIVHCPPDLLETGVVGPDLAAAFAEAPCDVAVVSNRDRRGAGPVAVPFGAAEHDWAAVELGAWIATATGSELLLVGSEGVDGSRDASRTLATASLLLQRHLGVASQPVLAAPGMDGILDAVATAGIVVAGIGDDWRRGIGRARIGLLRDARPPTVLVRRGDRPGGLGSPGAVTRHTWSKTR